MARSVAFTIFLGAVDIARRALNVAARCQSLPNIRVEMLEEARDKLHAACVLFEDGHGSEAHEDLYLPLFDALACVNDALILQTRWPALIGTALAALDSQFATGGV